MLNGGTGWRVASANGRGGGLRYGSPTTVKSGVAWRWQEGSKRHHLATHARDAKQNYTRLSQDDCFGHCCHVDGAAARALGRRNTNCPNVALCWQRVENIGMRQHAKQKQKNNKFLWGFGIGVRFWVSKIQRKSSSRPTNVKSSPCTTTRNPLSL